MRQEDGALTYILYFFIVGLTKTVHGENKEEIAAS
jgi:hypothetical protein